MIHYHCLKCCFVNFFFECTSTLHCLIHASLDYCLCCYTICSGSSWFESCFVCRLKAIGSTASGVSLDLFASSHPLVPRCSDPKRISLRNSKAIDAKECSYFWSLGSNLSYFQGHWIYHCSFVQDCEQGQWVATLTEMRLT